MRRRGYTLPEMLLVVALLGVLLVIALSSMRAPRERADTRATAEELAEQLRTCRSQALSLQCPVALGLPSSSGATPESTGYYVLEGWHSPSLSRTRNLTAEYPRTRIFVGFWSGLTWDYGTPMGARLADFLLPDWGAPHPDDPLLVFLPSGAVVSNLPRTSGSYRLVVANGVSYTLGDVSGTPCFQLQHSYQALTVVVNELGEVLIEAGVAGSPAGLDQVSPPSASGDPAPVYSFTASGNQDPEMVEPYLQVGPVPNDATLPVAAGAGASATLMPKSHMIVTVFARDPDGDKLWANYTATGPRGAGAYTKPNEERMIWDGERSCWRSDWVWHPPPDANPGERYELSVRVRDHRGGETDPTMVGVGFPMVHLLRNGRISFSKDGDIYVCEWDGTRRIRVAEKGRAARFAPDGVHIAFISTVTGEAMVVNRWGDGLRQLTNEGTPLDHLAWTSDSEELAYVVGDQLKMISAGASGGSPGPTVLVPALGLGGAKAEVSCHPSTDLHIIVVSRDGTPGPLQVICYDDTNPFVDTVPGSFAEVAVHPSGGEIAYLSGGSMQTATITFGAAVGTTTVGPGTAIGGGESPQWSPGGDRITFQVDGGADRDIFIADRDGGNRKQLFPTGGDYNDSTWSP